MVSFCSHLNWWSPIHTRNALFLCDYFQDLFSISLVCKVKLYVSLYGGFLFVIFGICSASWICRFVSFTKFGEFLTLFLQILFQLPCPIALSSTSGALVIKMFDLSIFPQVSEVIFIYFILVPLCSDGINSVVLFSSSLILFSLISTPFLSPSSKFFKCLLFLFSSVIFIWAFF